MGPQVGKELYENGALALLLVSIGIVAYLAVRFEWRFAVSAIAAHLHDVVIILGFFALFQWEFSLPVLAAVLAVLGYSVNESVVIADRMTIHADGVREGHDDLSERVAIGERLEAGAVRVELALDSSAVSWVRATFWLAASCSARCRSACLPAPQPPLPLREGTGRRPSAG